jgi:hypothetical protein
MTKGQRVSHSIYGLGTVLDVENSVKLNDYRYTGNLNVFVKFDNGGPQAFAENCTNDIRSLNVQDTERNT